MSLQIEENTTLKSYTTLKTGGVARYMATVETWADLLEAADFAKQNQLDHLVLGTGSNFLISDEGFPGLVIKINILGREYSEVGEDSIMLGCGAGEILDEVIADTVSRGYWGLENLSSIPGTVGATPVQNVGAYGVEIKDLVSEVETLHLPTKTRKVFTKEKCKFGYRDSFFKTDEGKNYIITKVFFNLSKKENPKIDYADLKKKFSTGKFSLSDIRQEVITIRFGKFPDWKILGTAGSFFKNPIITKSEAEELIKQYPDLPFYNVDDNNVKIPLGFVLDKLCQLKGYRVGAVGLYENQALVLVNYGEATATEIKNFADEIIKIVEIKTGIKVEPEVRFVF